MKKSIAPLLLAALATSGAQAAPSGAVDTIRAFYQDYLDHQQRSPGEPAFSQAFLQARNQNQQACRQYATGVCGWGADSNPYTDSQEADPGLRFANARFRIQETSPGRVRVRFNVYPSLKHGKDPFYDKTITYKMVRENGRWVVDDLAYRDGVSVRQKMAQETAYVTAHPDPDAPGTRQ